jgi:hypothetical protein
LKRHYFRALTLIALVAAPATAQLIDDRVPLERTLPLRQSLVHEIAGSRYHFGPFRLTPILQVNNLGYSNNVFATNEEDSQQNDFTATVAGGFHYVAPLGRKLFLRGDVLPEYTYYHQLEQNRSSGGTYSGAALALFNRMSLEAGANRTERVQLVTSELDRPATAVQDGFDAKAEVDVTGRIAVFGSHSTRDYTYDAIDNAGNPFSFYEQLEREDAATRVGARYKLTDFFDVSVLTEQTTSEFKSDVRDRNNESNAVLVGVHYDRPRMFVNLTMGTRKGEGTESNSAYPEYNELTGSYYTTWRFSRPLELDIYGHQGVVPALFERNPYLLETRNAIGLRYRVGRRLILRNSVEIGSNDYPVAVITNNTFTKRSDDVISYGGSVAVRVWRNVAFVVDAVQTDYDSNVDAFDRDVLRVGTSIQFKGDLWK